MSIRSSSSSSRAGTTTVAAPATTPTATATPPAAPTTAPALKSVYANGSLDSCTYTKQKDTGNPYGCYLFRSCQSCLETEGCMVNDLGICVSQNQGMTNLNTGYYQYSTSYNADMNYLNAIEKGLALPKAQTSNKNALAVEQNWHFRAGEATYCKADDAVCKECKASNFWRGNDTSALSDSRFCVGESGCVCIQTCEVPTFKSPGCQWKLTAPSPTQYYNNNYDSSSNGSHLALWEWLLVLLMIILVHIFYRCCTRSKKRQQKAAREEAARAVYQELGGAFQHP